MSPAFALLGYDVVIMIVYNSSIEMVKLATENVRRETGMSMGIVRCRNFRCLAKLGDDGIWRDSQGHALEVLEVVSQF